MQLRLSWRLKAWQSPSFLYFHKKCRVFNFCNVYYSVRYRERTRGGSIIKDEVVISKVKDGSEHAFRILIEKYRDHVFRTVYAVIRNQKDAEDISQEVFVRIYYALPQYSNQGFKTWLTRIAVNYAIDMKRKAERQKENPREIIEKASNENIEQQMLNKEIQVLVQRRLKEVPENYRQVIFDFYIEEKSYQQIAQERMVETKTVEMQLYRARKWLKKHWKEEEF